LPRVILNLSSALAPLKSRGTTSCEDGQVGWRIALYDGAAGSPNTPSTEVHFFTLNGTDNASVLTAALVAGPATRSVETYYTLNLPSTDFAALATGSSTFALGFQGPGEACSDRLTSSCSASISPP